MAANFGWKSALACAFNAICVTLLFHKELLKPREVVQQSDERRVPWPLVVLHVLFLAGVVVFGHHPVIFMLIPQEAPNAFATGRNPEHGVVAVTAGLLRLLSPEELRGVLSHEMGHIHNRDILVQSIAAVLGGVVVMLANMVTPRQIVNALEFPEYAGKSRSWRISGTASA